MTNDHDILLAALRWHSARQDRLEAGKHKRRLEAIKGGRGLLGHYKASLEVTELKRREQASLRALAKACEMQRGRLGRADDAATVQCLMLD